ncbi:MAG: hypothetical protein KF829_10430 [Ferruginibacter sp.]|nr:hypothetical protein [Ferruginibacter sp.]
MIEIIALFFLLRDLGNLANKKGQPQTRWIILGLVNWVFAEMMGIIIGLMIFSVNNLISVLIMGLMGGFAGYHLTRIRLNKFPDKGKKDDIDYTF